MHIRIIESNSKRHYKYGEGKITALKQPCRTKGYNILYEGECEELHKVGCTLFLEEFDVFANIIQIAYSIDGIIIYIVDSHIYIDETIPDELLKMKAAYFSDKMQEIELKPRKTRKEKRLLKFWEII